MDSSRYDFLIVGSGLFGATFARAATDKGYRCLVVERRSHTGGNIRCEAVEGINVHRYGPHIFHTSDRRIWDFVNALVPFNGFINKPLAHAADGKLYNLPFNMNTFRAMWGVTTPEEARAIIEEQRRNAMKDIHGEPRNLEEQALSMVGSDIYEKLIRHYTEKQWGRPCAELPAFIIRRLPVRFTYDNNYFNDTYQGIPIGGYNRLTEALLSGIDVRTGIDFKDIRGTWRDYADKLVYTGALDEYFDCSLGRLDWRTIRFANETLDTPNFQSNAVVNYTDAATPWTRIIEHKHFEALDADAVARNPRTVISREYSVEYRPGKEPFYPVNDSRNDSLAAAYRHLAEGEKDVIFGGRLAEYRYLDMAPVIASALASAHSNSK